METASNQQDSKALSYTYGEFDGDQVAHGFFTRRGGVSTGIYAGLNTGAGSNDDPQHVRQNRKIVAKALGTQSDRLLSLYQIHSDQCVVVSDIWGAEERPEGDSMVTDRPNIALGVLTADCTPVLFQGQKLDGSPVIGAAHAGWKGALGGILEATLREMVSLGAQAQSIKACIGPCIGKRSYEVDESFFKRFVERDDNHERFFGAAARNRHFMFDLGGYCALRLYESGLKNVGILGLDTYANEEEFFSYRRTTHREESDYGRQISTIMIRN